ncbi:MobF family relaxase [Phycicoccus elongatus]|nr:MobF family relaxase [Phycicoccus elongatus]
MTIHKLSAGSGYQYLTRQVAALDSTEKGATPLADYYSAKGESPGRWVGSGVSGVDGLEVGDVVTAEQMKRLFGTGVHPLTGDPLGAPYRVYDNSGIDGFNAEVARRVKAGGVSTSATAGEGGSIAGRPPYDVLARVRAEVARERFVADHGREPKNARELSDALARYSRPRRSAVAGFDLTFSPMKSVSTVWAIAPPEIARVIQAAHDGAVSDALEFIEQHALFTREGRNGARQVETHGLVATAFTHRDSRAGDPDLHTHVAVANRVQTANGKWLSIYGTVLFEHTVAASETYNTALELRLVEALGVEFADRPGVSTGSTARDRKRPVREIVGVPAELCERWSERRKAITVRQRELTQQFKATHGRSPSAVEAVALAQQANLETRETKHEPRSEAEQRKAWRAQAVELLGSARAVDDILVSVRRPTVGSRPQVTSAWVRESAEQVIAEVESRRATWQIQHLRAEAQRHVRTAVVPADQVAEIAEWIVDDAVGRLSIYLTPELDPITEPPALRRSDGTSVYQHTGRDHYTSPRVLEAEQRIVEAAGRLNGLAWSADEVQLSVLAAILDGVPLNSGQQDMVTTLATSGARVQLALAPAGSGKTTAMQVLANVWTEGGSNAVGLAPYAAAAGALAEATGMRCDTLAKVVHDLRHDATSSLVTSIGPGTLVVIDEAGMADTLTLAAVIEYAVGRGATVRLVGDDRQLAAVGAGGVLRDIAATHGAVRLDELVRFADPAEAEASLAMRDGDRSALGYYLDNDRVHVGDIDGCVHEVLEAWQRERTGGRDCLMLAPTRELVRELNLQAQAARVPAGASAPLSDGCAAHLGDVVITRRNDRRLGVSATDWVKNGDRWKVEAVRANGSLSVRHLASRLHVDLPAGYVAAHVELGYASTVRTAQGITTDVLHGIVTGVEDRQLLYTMLTRGRVENHAHLVLGREETHALPGPADDRALTATEVLEGILARDGAAVSATSTRTAAATPEAQLHDAVTRYGDAVALAASKLLAAPDRAGAGPLPWLAGIPEVVADHPSWGPYVAVRSRRVSALAGEVSHRAVLPRWIKRYDDVLTADLRRELAVWRAATGVPDGGRSLVGPPPNDDAEAAYHRNLTNRINARYGEALRAWQDRIVAYVGHRDEQTGQLAKYLDGLQPKGVDAERFLELAVARKPLPVDHPTAALAYRVKDLAARRDRNAGLVDDFRRATPSTGPTLGL